MGRSQSVGQLAAKLAELFIKIDFLKQLSHIFTSESCMINRWPAILVLVCQEREAALDAIMGKIRQEATEAGLKEGLKKAGQMLDTIRARCVHLQWSAFVVFSLAESSNRCVKNRGVESASGSESLILSRLRLWALSSGLLCNFVAVYLTFVQFISQLNYVCTLLCTFYQKNLKFLWSRP